MADTKSAAVNRKRKRPKKFLCGVPYDHCVGGTQRTSHGLKGGYKSHNTTFEAAKCYADYLVNVLKYTQIGPREFAAPDDGPIHVLTKKSRFGARLRGGKEERMMPAQFCGGTIVSS